MSTRSSSVVASSPGPQLLVSVRTIQEGLDALAGGADIVDIKDPSRGTLGMADLLLQYQIAAAVRGSSPVPLSAALGELADWQSKPMPALPPHLQYAKLGLAGMAREPHWQAIWKQVRSEFDVLRGRPLDWVAVAYADAEAVHAPPVLEVLQAAIDTNCRVLLIDTCQKGELRLVDRIPQPQLRQLVDRAHFHGLRIALAGQIRPADLAQLAAVGPDIIAVRGAACTGGDRGNTISSAAVSDLAHQLRSVPQSAPSAGTHPPAPAEGREAGSRKLTLDQFIKLQGWVGTGGQAKFVIQQGLVRVNGEIDTRRRRQMSIGDVVEFDGNRGTVESID